MTVILPFISSEKIYSKISKNQYTGATEPNSDGQFMKINWSAPLLKWIEKKYDRWGTRWIRIGQRKKWVSIWECDRIHHWFQWLMLIILHNYSNLLDGRMGKRAHNWVKNIATTASILFFDSKHFICSTE